MRQSISGLAAAIAVMSVSAAPAMACGGLFPGYGGPCAESYVPTQVYTGCYSGCGGWTYERLPDPVQQYHSVYPVQQYYYVNQGPTYTGPGAFAPYPTYQESAVSGWDAYRRRPYYYGYDGGRYANATNHRYDGAPNVEGPVIYSYHAHRHHPWRTHAGYRYRVGPSGRYGYAPHDGVRYGAHTDMPHDDGHHERTMRRDD
jgi:hypothetical protein